MSGINLLPWREWERERRQRQFVINLAAVLAASVALLLVAGFVLDGRVSDQAARNRFLQDEIAVLDQQIAEIASLRKTRQELLARIQVILELQSNRPTVVHVFDELVRTVPAGLHFNTLRMEGTTLTLEAQAESNNRISALMRNLDGSRLFSEPSLKSIKEDPGNAHYGNQASVFNLTFVQTPPGGDAAPQTGTP
ncbi:MAG: PilN domain-containing protein [Gammaproteobacteria bacterium]|jgi:type IV pilus assembly protein PilN